MFLYLHGFASSPRSLKAIELANRFAQRHIALHSPDLNQNDFTHLTLSRQIDQVKALLPPREAVTIVGSSFGGLTAAWIAQQSPQVARLVLLAPAFGMLHHWLQKLDPQTLAQWRSGEPLLVHHYGENRSLPLDYQFVVDLERYDERQLKRPIPTLILHGVNDDVIPIAASRSYAATRSWVELIELESDHALVDQTDQIWNAICRFCWLSL